MWGTETAVKAWVIAVDMGLGHQRALYPLTHLAEGGVVTLGGGADNESVAEFRLWSKLRRTYEMVSRIKPGFLIFSTRADWPRPPATAS
jgi:hypothetical protein